MTFREKAVWRLLALLPARLKPQLFEYLMAFGLYADGTKVLNLLHCELERRRLAVRRRSRPYGGFLDVTNRCNLRCPYCFTGHGLKDGREVRFVAPETVQRLVDEAGRYLIGINLFNWGEPFLHPEIAAIIRTFHEARIFTKIASNLNVRKPQVLEAAMRAGLDYLSVSLDGVTQEVYAKYRKGGDLKLVLDNLRFLVARRRQLGLRTPVIEWQFLVFPHNRHELAAARDLAAHLGVDIFKARSGAAPVRQDVAGEEGRLAALAVCEQLWRSLVVQSDGGILPCCYLFFRRDDFGRLDQGPLLEILNGARFLWARRLFRPESAAHLPPDFQHPCLICPLIHSQPHLQDFLAAGGHREAIDAWRHTGQFIDR